jgi:hypothetical protein
MDKSHEKKLSIDKFTVSKINNQRMIFGGTTDDGPITILPKTQKTRPTRPPKPTREV